MILSQERSAKLRATITLDREVVNSELFLPPTSAVTRNKVCKSTYYNDGLEPLPQQTFEREAKCHDDCPRHKAGISVRKA
ncbi:hypothetical protein V1281_004712 [Nitrobacteraceae bacterium AZCC 2161]